MLVYEKMVEYSVCMKRLVGTDNYFEEDLPSPRSGQQLIWATTLVLKQVRTFKGGFAGNTLLSYVSNRQTRFQRLEKFNLPLGVS